MLSPYSEIMRANSRRWGLDAGRQSWTIIAKDFEPASSKSLLYVKKISLIHFESLQNKSDYITCLAFFGMLVQIKVIYECFNPPSRKEILSKASIVEINFELKSKVLIIWNIAMYHAQIEFMETAYYGCTKCR